MLAGSLPALALNPGLSSTRGLMAGYTVGGLVGLGVATWLTHGASQESHATRMWGLEFGGVQLQPVVDDSGTRGGWMVGTGGRF